MQKLLEIACFNLESALIAQSAGADRIEFCQDYKAGGVTPTREAIVDVRQRISIPICVIIRPRAGDFVYNSEELEEMSAGILFCKQQRIDGVVFGVLNDDSVIDEAASRQLIALAKPMSITFHRAIDGCRSLKAGMQQLIDLGCDKVLTSGGHRTAEEGLVVISELQQNFGDQIIIMPGGGIRSSNISAVISGSRCHEFHSAAITDENEIADGKEVRALLRYLGALKA